MIKFELFWVICGVISVTSGIYENQPKLITEDGNLCISSAKDKNISLEIKGRGRFLVNNVDVLQLIHRNDSIDGTSPIDQISMNRLRNRVNVLYNDVRGTRRGILRRLSRLENGTRSGVAPGQPRLRDLRQRVLRLETTMETLMTKLTEDNCRSNPCNNGGTCVDIFDGFICHCPANYQGATCVYDVNECERFEGTDLGCQNGATCMNSYGSYFCHCPPGFHGVHCTKRDTNCTTATSGELCGHGVCVHTDDPTGYRCLCDQGWQTDGAHPMCNRDVDECQSKIPHCSHDPPVVCINTAGSYTCGACPAGYSGNGYSCADVDECQFNNGFIGDGKTCTQSTTGGRCATSPNVCHPDATCQDVGQTIICRCKAGFSGDGFGPFGCRPSTNTCDPNPCLNGGTCVFNGTAAKCTCPPGNSSLCVVIHHEIPVISIPVSMGARASVRLEKWVSHATARDPSQDCCTERRACGGTLTAERGTLKYPEDGSITYNHNSRCAWLIRVNSTKVLNVTFTKFKLEDSVECRYDWLQIHDGRSSAYHMIGRYCGTDIRPGHTIISTQNYLYFWFRSDSSTSNDGFELTWESIDPRCGGLIAASSYGTITSPGSPGNYPPNRDCQWVIQAPAGKRIQLHFFVMKIEYHETCKFDYLAIYGGPTVDSPLLEKFCNTTHPPPLLTPTNEATLFFHSDEDSTDAGFQIHYSVVEGYPGCGGTFTAYSGEFGSPIEDESYPNNLVCEYVVKYPKGSKIRITFKSFHLEDSEGCRFDKLELFEIGSDGSRELVRSYCGSEVPKPYKSTGNEMMLIFTSDWSHAYGGFRIGYQIECGGTFEDESGIITSPMYPEPYHDSRTCEYIIQAPLKKVISLKFDDFDLEENSYPDCYYDSLEIYDGVPQTNATKIGRYCWSISPPNFISTYNVLYMILETDSSIGGRGFKANYSFIDVKCGGIVTTSGTVVTSPESDEITDSSTTTYAHSTTCHWLITAPGDHNVQLTWINFKIEHESTCDYDYVEIFDNSTDPGRSVGRYCGTRTPPIITSLGHSMTVKFVSDESVSEGSFSFMVTFLHASNTCGGRFFSSFGYIRSPGWPDMYQDNKECEWIISVENGAQIELKVKSFELEEHGDCEFDFLEVRNGGKSDSPLIGKYCGTKIPGVIRSFANQLYVKFVSDSSRMERGFEIEWDGTSMGCGGTLTSPRGSIISPNYPMPYAENAQCVWKIVVSQGSTVQIIFSDLDLEKSADCSYDYLEVFDGKDAGSTSLGKFCSAEDHPLYLETTGSFAMIRMRTDYSGQGRGFSLRYDTICKREVSSLGGVIESPNFPQNYPHSLNCEWIIRAPLGNKVYIEFLHFEVENGDATDGENHVCNFDYVTIEEKIDQVTNKKKFCNHAPAPYTSQGEVVVVGFTTDISVSHTGFRLEYHVEGCGGVLTRPTGTISSPNYPGIYPHHVHCYWTIKAPYGNAIELTITEFELEVNEDCVYDGLKIANGPSMTNIITTLCHVQTKTLKYTSSGADMYLFFYTDVSLSGKGFNSSYRFVPAKCGGTFSVEGNIYSPNYPKNYDGNTNCEWLLQTDLTHRLQISFLDFDLETSSECIHDSVRIYEGNTANETKLIRNLCDSQLPNPAVLTLSTNEALVVFRTDSSIEAKGFHMNFTSACGSRIVTNSSGQLTKVTSVYERSSQCTWTIISEDPSKKIALTVTQLNVLKFDSMNSNQSVLIVFDGDSENATEVGTYTEAPPTIYSSGNSITMKTYSNSDYDIIVAYLMAQYSVFENSCGGTLKSVKGDFASPSYPNSYPANVECIWSIEASPGNKIQVEFSEFALADSPTCSEEYVEIRETNGGGKVLGVFCGNNQPTNLTTAEVIWIKFRSGPDVMNVERKFYASFSYVDEVEIVNAERGVVTSPMYPLYVHSPILNGWRISVEYGYVISLSVKDVRISGDCYYYVQIYDGFNEEGPTLGEKLCGDIDSESMTSTSNVVYIDTNIPYPTMMGVRFKIEWQKVPKVATSNPNELATTCGLTNIVLSKNSTNVNLTSPGYPEGYDSNLNCTWIVSSDDRAYHPVFVISYLDLEDTADCVSDRLIISESKDMIVWKKLAQICNIDYRSHQSYNGNPFLKIEFLTDWGMNRTGFRGSLTEDCGGYMTGPTGKISGGVQTIPERFARFTTSCVWEIHVRQGRTIKFDFQDFTFPRSREPTACEGYILFKNGGSEDSPLLGEGKYCGDGEKPTIPTTISNRAYVKFEYGGNFRSHFSMTYEEVSLSCGGTLHLTEDVNNTVITSPNYPNIPHPHTECVWIIFAPNGETIKINFEERFDLTRSPGCDKEYVEIRSGGTRNSGLIGTFCDQMPPTLESQSNILRVKYFTDVSDPKNGFKARVSIATCSGTLRQNQGVLTSPKYPGKGAYPAKSVCTYRIIGSPLTHLNISFTDLDLPPAADNDTCLLDRVTVYAVIQGETDSSNKQPRGTFCGSKIPDSFFIDSHEAIIEFTTSEHQELYRGFSLHFNVGKETCGEAINAESGIITSPGYPNGRQNRRFCEWAITVPKGRRVKAELLDLDLIPASHTYSQRLGFYHDHRYLSRIRFIKGEDPIQTVYSSDNKMLINMWVRVPSNHRGFKLQFSSNEPTVCLGNLNNVEGTIDPPQNLTTFYCEYTRDVGAFYPEELGTGTLAIRVKDAYIGRAPNCRLASTRIAVFWLGGADLDSQYLQYICRNVSDITVRSPFPDTKLEVRQGLYYGPMSFKLNHRIHKCGGIIRRASVLTQPTFAANYGIVDCAWQIRQDDGFAINLQVQQVNLTRPCDEEYINIYNGPTQLSPHLMKICSGTTELNSVMSQNNFLFMEYHSHEYSQSSVFKIHVVPAVSGCGGIIHKYTETIKSPGNASYYPNNIECVWEFRPDPGFHVGLEFVDRFYIEDSVNCTKDYIEILDLRNGEWHSLGRVCGRETPPIFNATESSLKLVFRTDGSVSGDGFSVKWYQNCGGLYEVRETTPEIIYSPNYPQNYARLLNCNYTFVAPPDEYIIIDFKDFELEESVGRCIFDNVTIYKANEWSVTEPPVEAGVYCRRDSPGVGRFKNFVSVVFRTDKWVERKGFQFTYKLDSCGGTITNSTLITSPDFDTMNYPNDANCVWNITAPVSKSILVKFEKFDIEGMDTCYADFVSVFQGSEMKDEARLAKLCGNITNPPAVKTDFSSAIVHFKSDLYNNKGGFSAAILFMPACDRRVTLTPSALTYHLDIRDSNYEELQDCHYYITAPSDYTLRLHFTRFHVAPCDNNSTKVDCSCDYVEVRDGGGPLSELVGKFCGHDLPQDVTTSKSAIFVRFVTDSRTKSTGFSAELTAVLNPCGERHLNVSQGPQTIESPGRTKYPANIKCSWIVENDLYRNMELIFEKFDLQGSDGEGRCSYDQLEIADESLLDRLDVAFGEDLVFNGVTEQKVGFYQGTRNPVAHHHYCGNSTPADYISRTHRVHLTLRTDSEIERGGFRIVAKSLTGCSRNYTETQGRIFMSETTDCEVYINVPENYTIAGNVKSSAYVYGGSFDLTFLATDQGRGCGGFLYNYGGSFSSPLYPLNDRNNSQCTWDVNVPSNLKVALRFHVFDMGTKLTCPSNYVEFQEVEADGKTRVERTYCGDDIPAVYKSEKSRILVHFVKDVNFAGSGWVLQFMGVHENSEVYNW
uniref:Cubilin n=1 Tax=Lutzomyia longipalpis TaxID=7200 RepID=A0A7G3AGB7_LUTLO